MGDVKDAFSKCANIYMKEQPRIGGQEQLYLETQGAYAYPTEHDSVKIYFIHSRSHTGATYCCKSVGCWYE